MKKTTSETLSKRLTQYSALSLALAGIVDVNGQIVYHDILDVVGSNDYNINLNPDDGITPGGLADAIDDFRIFNSNAIPSSGFIKLEALSNNSVIASASAFTYPFALGPDYVISSANPNWLNNQYQVMVYASSCIYGKWCSATDQYLGLRFDINGNTHYGWAKLDADAVSLTWILKEFAFNATPGEPIKTGQTTLSTDNTVFSKVKIVSTNKSITLFNLPQQTEYNVFNISGQSVLNGDASSNKYVIEANTLAKGIYIIELKDPNSSALVRKKIAL